MPRKRHCPLVASDLSRLAPETLNQHPALPPCCLLAACCAHPCWREGFDVSSSCFLALTAALLAFGRALQSRAAPTLPSPSDTRYHVGDIWL